MITADQAMRVAVDLEMAAQAATLAYYLSSHTESRFHFDELERKFRQAADELGFDLVKRQTAQEAHEAQLARRMAEDIADVEIILGR